MEHTIRLLPTLVYIQSHLAEDLALERLAGYADLSPFHFHRLFHDTIGETLKQYTLRLRLERAAYALRLQDGSILDIALNCGFHSHETFSRAFKRWFGSTPRQFRQGNGRFPATPSSNSHLLNQMTTEYQLSKVTIQQRHPIHVAFLRHIGDYTKVDPELFDHLVAWAKASNKFSPTHALIGVAHDAPTITPVDKLRFDACIEVAAPIEPFAPIGYQIIPGGAYAIASYIGPFNHTLSQAYVEMFTQIMQLKNVEFVGLPAVEIYRTTTINPDYALNHTDICLPVIKK
ncbi:MAG: AraC family transcriptional regulator [Chloroflexi bacterium]|nr:AraC family transcriptional regulator [Chloroflexota bacterium]